MTEPQQAPEKSRGAIILGWWSTHLGNRETGRARALAARLRRADPVSALAEGEVHDLSRALGLRDGAALARLACLLAEVREHSGQTLAQRLGGSEPILSTLRFQKLIRAEEPELTALMRRAIGMADGICNVASLGPDLLDWSEAVRMRWCFHYYGAQHPQNLAPQANKTEEISQ